MNEDYDKKQNVESLTVGQLVVSMKPSQLRSTIGVAVTIMVVVFYFGYHIAQHSSELDMKAHLIKDAEENNKFQGQLKGLEEEKVDLKKKCKRSQEIQSPYQVGDISIIELPPKQGVLIRVVPKEDIADD